MIGEIAKENVGIHVMDLTQGSQEVSIDPYPFWSIMVRKSMSNFEGIRIILEIKTQILLNYRNREHTL